MWTLEDLAMEVKEKERNWGEVALNPFCMKVLNVPSMQLILLKSL